MPRSTKTILLPKKISSTALICAFCIALIFLAQKNAYALLTEKDIGQECINALDGKTDFTIIRNYIPKTLPEPHRVDLPSNPRFLILKEHSNKYKNTDLVVLLKGTKENTYSWCRKIISSYGSQISVAGTNDDSSMPIFKVNYYMGPEIKSYSKQEFEFKLRFWARMNFDYGYKRPVFHHTKEKALSEALNEQALKVFKAGDIEEAIRIWRFATGFYYGDPRAGFTSNAEVSNNLGFAYYKLFRESGDYDHFRSAYYNFQHALEVEPRRWQAYLNMGDLELEMKAYNSARYDYEKLLELNPSYKYEDKIKERIKWLKTLPYEVGEEVVVWRNFDGVKQVSYLRADKNTVLRKHFGDNGELEDTDTIKTKYSPKKQIP